MKATKLPALGRHTAEALTAMHGPGRRRRVCNGWSAVAVLMAAAVALPGCRSSPARPDIVLVTIDTLRADHCSSYGYPVPTTPSLDALAAGGVLFRRAYAESSTTAPSHAVMMTGRHFRTLGVGKNGHVLSQDATTLAEVLRDSGYQTAAFVSSFPLQMRFGFSQGFDLYDDSFIPDEASLGRRKPDREAHDRLAGATFAHVERWLAGRKDPRPLFLWVHFVDPHAPYRAPETFEAAWPDNTSLAVARYDAEVRYADRQLGNLLAAVSRSTPAREDFVVVTSDHGEGLGDHGWMNHGENLYEEAVRIPLVASWPGRLEAGKVVEEPVALVDIPRGILELLGIDAKEFAHGRNLFAANDPSRAIFLQRRDYVSSMQKGQLVGGVMTAVVEGGSKLIVAPEEQRRELYDLTNDPRELGNRLGGRRKAGPRSAPVPGPEPPAGLEQQETARKLEDTLRAWADAFPPSGSDQPLDEETKKALRSLGYVD